jgi:hypothetical protein
MRLVLWPAVVTLAITLLRLVGELQGWSRFLFNPDAGGGGALVGISWLPFLFGPYFAWKLAKEGKPPRSAWRVVGLALLGAVLAIAVFAAAQILGPMPWSVVVALFVSLALAFLPWKAWPELAHALPLRAGRAHPRHDRHALRHLRRVGDPLRRAASGSDSPARRGGPSAALALDRARSPGHDLDRPHGAGGVSAGSARGGARQAAACGPGCLTASGFPLGKGCHSLPRGAPA